MKHTTMQYSADTRTFPRYIVLAYTDGVDGVSLLNAVVPTWMGDH